MTNKEQMILDAKDEAAREKGYESYEDFMDYHSEVFLPDSMAEFTNRAMEIYAEKVGDAQWNAAIEKAAVIGVRECRGYYEHEIYTSILKLKKP